MVIKQAVERGIHAVVHIVHGRPGSVDGLCLVGHLAAHLPHCHGRARVAASQLGPLLSLLLLTRLRHALGDDVDAQGERRRRIVATRLGNDAESSLLGAVQRVEVVLREQLLERLVDLAGDRVEEVGARRVACVIKEKLM